jgi:hypothetical protein
MRCDSVVGAIERLIQSGKLTVSGDTIMMYEIDVSHGAEIGPMSDSCADPFEVTRSEDGVDRPRDIAPIGWIERLRN